MKTNISAVNKTLTLGRGGKLQSADKNLVVAVSSEQGVGRKGYGLPATGLGCDGLFMEDFKGQSINSNQDVIEVFTEFNIRDALGFKSKSIEFAEAGDGTPVQTLSINVSGIDPKKVVEIDLACSLIADSYSVRCDSWQHFVDSLNTRFYLDQLTGISVSYNVDTETLVFSSSTYPNVNLQQITLSGAEYAQISFNDESERFLFTHPVDGLGTIVPYEAGIQAIAEKTFVVYQDRLYMCTSDHTTTDTFNSAFWKLIPKVFGGATASAAGDEGLVPAPAAGDQGKVLMGSGQFERLEFSDVDQLPELSTQVATNKSDIAGIQQQLADTEHFRGYYATTAEIQAITNPHNGDYAYNAETGTKWIYGDSGWADSGVAVPDKMVPKSTSTPLMDGTASVGVEEAYAAGDHRHPTDTTRAADSEVVKLTGDQEISGKKVIVSGGKLQIADLPVDDQDAVNKQYVDNKGTGIDNWQPDTEYEALKSNVIYDDIIYQCKENHVSAGTFDITKWTKLNGDFSIDDQIFELAEDANSVEVNFQIADPSNVSVYKDGIKLLRSQYTVTVPSTIQFSELATAGSRIEVQYLQGSELVATKEVRHITYTAPSDGISNITLGILLQSKEQIVSVNKENHTILYGEYSLGSDNQSISLANPLLTGERIEIVVLPNVDISAQGVTFTPKIENNILTWTNDGGLANPQPLDFNPVFEGQSRIGNKISTVDPADRGKITLQDEFTFYKLTSVENTTYQISFDGSQLPNLNADTDNTFQLQIYVSSGSSYSWPTSVDWEQGTPDMSAVGNYRFVFSSTDGGIKWLGNLQRYWA